MESSIHTADGADFEAHLAPILPIALRAALHWTQHREDAEDLVQEAALRAFRAFDTFEPGTNFKAWFLRIQHNCFLGRLRQASRRPQTVGVENDETLESLFLYEQMRQAGPSSGSNDPAAMLLARLDAEQISAALGALPDEFRTVATLSFIAQLSYEEIARIVDCPLNTVRSRLHRSRKLLQKALWEVAKERGWQVDEPQEEKSSSKKPKQASGRAGMGSFFFLLIVARFGNF